MAPGKDLEHEARQLTEIIRATWQMLDSRALPNAKREQLQKEVDLRIAARKALLKRLWVIPRTGTTVPNQL